MNSFDVFVIKGFTVPLQDILSEKYIALQNHIIYNLSINLKFLRIFEKLQNWFAQMTNYFANLKLSG